MALKCSGCGNEKNFQVKTLQLYVLQVEDAGFDVVQDGRPALLELLCDECEEGVDLNDLDVDERRELLQSI